MVLKSYEVLEIDAIVIMGILILVTFLNTNIEDSLADKMKTKGFELLLEREQVEKFLEKCDSIDNSEKSELQSECETMNVKLLEIEAEFTALNEIATEIFQYVPEYENAKTYKTSPEWSLFWGFVYEPVARINNVNFWSAILIFPFAISAAYEAYTTRRKKEEEASEKGVASMIIGFLLIFPLLFVVVMSS